jgi:hypothetical protein
VSSVGECPNWQQLPKKKVSAFSTLLLDCDSWTTYVNQLPLTLSAVHFRHSKTPTSRS